MDPPPGGRLRLRVRGPRAVLRGRPLVGDAWRDAIARAQAHPRDRERVAEVVTAQQERRGAPAEARAAAARLADPRTVAVVTGQQAGLFGGPLFTLLKAITAVKLAERVAREHGVPTVPIFWIESEDHDWEEVASCAVLDGDMRRRTITLGTPPGAGEQPVAAVRLDPSIFAAVEGLTRSCPPPSSPTRCAEACRPPTTRAPTMSEAFDRWLEVAARAARPRRLRLRPSRATKPLVREVFARELETPGATTRLAPDDGRRAGRASATTRRSCRTTTTSRCSGSTTSGSRSTTATGRSLSATRRCRRRPREGSARAPRRLQPERAAAPDRPGHALPDRVLRRRARTSSPTSASCGRSTRTSACRCR